MTLVSSEWERGYDAGYRAALGTARRDIGRDIGKSTPTKRTRKPRKKDPKMARALEEANRKGRTKAGKLRKGWNQSRIMTLAHKIKKGL